MIQYNVDLWWVRYLPARQSTSTQSKRDIQPSEMGDVQRSQI